MGRHRLNFKPFGLKFKEELNFRMKVLQLLLLVGIVSCFPGRYSRYYPRYGYRTYSYGGYRKPFTAFNSAQKERFAARTGSSAQNSAFFRLGNVNVDKYVNEALRTPLLQDSRVKAANDLTSPTAAAALAYMKPVTKDGLCGVPTELYLESIFNGKSKEEANAEATRAYIEAYNRGERLPQGGACAAADAAWREAARSGGDPVLEASLAFINAWPGVTDGNPCAVSGIDYVKAIIAGKSHLEANTIATTGFANAFKTLAKQGKPLKDVACRDATKAFFEAIPEKPDPANAAAFYPVCLSSLDAFIESYNGGDDLLTANLKSAQSFFKEFAKGSNISPDSPCAAATLAYANEITKKPSAPNAAAMIAYITEAVTRQGREFDPVCAAATDAYFDAYIQDKSEASANEAAAVAYLGSLEKSPNFDVNSACGKAAAAYIA